MTGLEFKAALKYAGYTNTAFAKEMGVHRDTIGKQCHAGRVEIYWAFALAGVITSKSLGDVISIVEKINK